MESNFDTKSTPSSFLPQAIEISKLFQDDVLELEIDFSPYVSPTVVPPKSNDKMR